MKYLSVKNFEHFQHYKDRAPTWIKLYNALLDDYGFLSLSEVARSHLMLIWLIASRHENRIPYDAAYIQRAIHAKSKIDLATLIRSGFLIEMEESSSDALADVAHSASSNGAKTERADSPHARGRAVAREEKRERREESMSAECDSSAFGAAWQRYPKRLGGNAPADAEAAWHARIREGEDPAVMQAGTERYRRFCEATGKVGTEYVMQGKRFFGKSKQYLEPWEEPEEELSELARAAIAQRDAPDEGERRLRERERLAVGNGAVP